MKHTMKMGGPCMACVNSMGCMMPTLLDEEKVDLREFWRRQATWSRETFGPDEVRGPQGPLKHLVKEVTEELLPTIEDGTCVLDRDGFVEEFADVQFLIFDACRRAGFNYDDLRRACIKKLKKNLARDWPDWRTRSRTDPIEHVRDK